MAKKNNSEMPAKEKKVSLSEKVGDFIQKYRFVFLTVLALLVVGFVAYGVIYNSASKKTSKLLSKIEKIEFSLLENTSELSESEVSSLLDDSLKAVEEYTKNSGIVGIRAELLKADICYKKSDYKNACDSYLKVASKTKGTYLCPISYFNAARSSEQLNDTTKAIEYYQMAANDKEFVNINQALFSIGRIKESSLDYEGAYETYEKIVSKNESDTWSNLAKTRILTLELEGKVNK